MIHFRFIRWKNFLSTGSAFTEIRLDRMDNTLIIGENGAGKSTVLDALCYNLFGDPFRKINLPTLINSINNSDLVTECEFVIGTNVYLIRRGMKPTLFEIYKDGKMIDQPGKALDYQNHLETFILRSNKKTFTQVAVLGNATHVPFMQLKAADRRAIIDDILDVQVFSVMLQLLKRRIDVLDEQLLENKHEYDLIEKEISIKEIHIEQLRKDKQKEIDELNGKIVDVNTWIADITREISEHEEEIRLSREKIANKLVWTEKQKKSNEYFIGIQRNLSKANSDIDFWSSTEVCPTCEQAIDKDKAQAKLHDCKTKRETYEIALTKLQKLLQQAQAALATIGALEQNITYYNSEIGKKNSKIAVMKQVIADHERKKEAIEKSHELLDKTEAELVHLREKLVVLDSEKARLMDDQAHLNIAEGVFKDKGIKARIVKQYLPIINKLVNKYLAEQEFFVNFELDETFKEVIKSRYRDEFSYENFSEGEKQKIDMSLMLTWREVAKLKNSAATNILILDEIFDSSLDAQGVEYLMKLLHSLEKCNLFVISHKGDILQDKFHSVVKFEKQGNYSRIV